MWSSGFRIKQSQINEMGGKIDKLVDGGRGLILEQDLGFCSMKRNRDRTRDSLTLLLDSSESWGGGGGLRGRSVVEPSVTSLRRLTWKLTMSNVGSLIEICSALEWRWSRSHDWRECWGRASGFCICTISPSWMRVEVSYKEGLIQAGSRSLTVL